MIDTQNKQIEFLLEQNKKLIETQNELKAQIEKMQEVQSSLIQNQNELMKQLQLLTSSSKLTEDQKSPTSARSKGQQTK